MKKTARRKVTFRMPAEPGSRVSVAGTFNDWDPDKHLMTDQSEPGIFQIVIGLSPGKHEYKFVIDGVWHPDPQCPEWVANGHGTLNSVLTVQA